jgi:hypothetical protein
MPPRRRQKTRAKNRAAGAPAREVYRVRILSGECLATLELYPALRADGIGCGCFHCFPVAYCVFEDEGENRCREPRFTAKEANQTPYCYNHWRQFVRQPEMTSLGEIIKSAQAAPLGPGVKS